MLLLAKIENKPFPARDNIEINILVAKYINDFQDFSGYKEIQIEIIETDPVVAHGDLSLAHILIANLIKNALFHNKQKGTVNIRFSGSSFQICNTGIDNSLDKVTIFNRFQKGCTDNASNGLGLAVCRAICDYYGFRLN